MSDLTTVLECQVCLEYLDAGRSFVSKRVNYKKCSLSLIRNEFREILLRITEKGKLITTLQLQSITVHKKFLTEGKATLKFPHNNLSVLISNAPCSELLSFLRLMSIKMVGSEGKGPSIRAKLLSAKTPCVEDISPLTEKDYQKVKMKMKDKDETPKSTGGCKRLMESKSEFKSKRNCLMQIVQQSLSKEQKVVLQAAKDGHNIFFTGSAGTGKSHLLKSIASALPPDVTFATASTAMAASQIGGTTLHQFAGIGMGQGSVQHLVSLASRPGAQAVWKKCQHLIIDEISMVHGDFFEKLEYIARKIRKNEKPFGGIQLILCGDFFQLPPVGNPVVFCFQTKAWEKCITRMFELKEIHRQSDPVLINILQNVRLGRITDDITKKLQDTALHNIEKNGILATRLCTHTAESVSINQSKLDELPGEVKTFKAVDEPESLSSFIDKQSRVQSTVPLKIGAQVMLLKNLNISKGLVNGARGVVVKFDTDGLPIVQFNSGTHKIMREKFVSKSVTGAVLSRTQIPLTLAWAFSIHKSQGLTLDCIELSLARVFEPGHSYVALSRVKSLGCLRVLDFNSKQVWANENVLRYYAKFKRRMNEMNFLSE
ncbi:UNVERIFIED_CONTAM: hypothetical protein PYX00_001485 [Menopon gallinae]|uniref:ATP-dependent DNA helicase PIF1 n=1 Tax=Menopon gallinae TaxID=328185 RepID=A0AAW2ICY5_9NEOP